MRGVCVARCRMCAEAALATTGAKMNGPPFRAEHVGSLLRPSALTTAFRAWSAGEIDDDAFRRVQDECIRDVAALQEEGAVGRDFAMPELTAGMGPALRAASTVPGGDRRFGGVLRIPAPGSRSRRRPGVMAYELATSTRAAVSSASRGRQLAADVQTGITTTVQGGTVRDARKADRRLA